MAFNVAFGPKQRGEQVTKGRVQACSGAGGAAPRIDSLSELWIE
jgi:hypothetical protein